MKSTLDKDLDKVSQLEEVTYHVTKSVVPLGLGLVFLIAVSLIASIYVIGRPDALIMIAAITIGGYMAMNIGANDVANNVGPPVGSRALTLRTALLLAAFSEIAGALLAGSSVVDTISSGIINATTVPDADEYIGAMMAALLAAALWVNLATWINAPVSTTHAIVGGVVGAGIMAAGLSAVDWLSLLVVASGWMISPLLSAIVAVGFLATIKDKIIYRQDKVAAAKIWVPILLGMMAAVFVSYLVWVSISQRAEMPFWATLLTGMISGIIIWRIAIPFIARQAMGLENRNSSIKMLFRWPLIVAAVSLSFAHGANDVSNAVGPVVAIVSAADNHSPLGEASSHIWVMLIGAFGLSVGILLFVPRLIKLVGAQITKLNQMRAYCVSMATALTVLMASAIGLPISTTHTAVGAVFGVGFYREWYMRRAHVQALANHASSQLDVEPSGYESNISEQRRRYLVRRSHFMTIIAAWLITLPASGLFAAMLYWIIFKHVI